MSKAQKKSYKIIFPILLSVFITSCKKQPEFKQKLPPKLVQGDEQSLGKDHYIGEPDKMPQGVFNTPSIPVPSITQTAKKDEPQKLTGAPADFSLSQVPIPTFIKMVL